MSARRYRETRLDCEVCGVWTGWKGRDMGWRKGLRGGARNGGEGCGAAERDMHMVKGGGKVVVSECGCGGGPAPGSRPMVRGMAGNTSKVEARRRVREAQARANEARAQRERANVEDAATVMVAAGKVSEVDAWETERLAQLREQVRAEANKRRGDHRAEAGAAIARMQQRGETLATIAELASAGVGEIRALLRYAPKSETRTAAGASGALGGVGDGAGPGEQRGAARAAAAGGERWTSAASPASVGGEHAVSA